MLRAGGDAEAAGVAVGGAYCEGLSIPMRPGFEACAKRQRASLLDAERAHLENVVGAHLHAIFLAFASIAIDDRHKQACFLLALNIG